jgi:putative SOS response-associated peptidase YedK
MPVVLEDEDWTVWLGEGTEESDGAVGEALPLLVPAGDSVLTMIDVGPLVNSVRNNSAELIQAVGH